MLYRILASLEGLHYCFVHQFSDICDVVFAIFKVYRMKYIYLPWVWVIIL